MKKLWIAALFSILIVCFATSASAALFNVNYDAVQRIISDDLSQKAIFNLTITNSQNTPDSFNLAMENDMWQLFTDPLYAYQTKYGLTTGAFNSSNSTSALIYLTPAKKLAPGMYRVYFSITSQNTGETDSQSFLITVRNLEGFGEYLPTIRADATTSNEGKTDPRKKATISVKLDNLNPLNISDLTILVVGDNINKELKTTLGPLEQKTEQIELSFDPLAAPSVKDYQLLVKIDGEVVKTIKTNVELLPYSELEKTSSMTKSFLRREYTYTYKHNGNVNRQETITVATTYSKSLFTKTSPEASSTESDKGVDLKWYVNLKPQEEYSVKVTENFRMLFFVVLLLILAVLGYYIFRSPIIMKKEATITGTSDGGITEVKVLLYIQNRTRTQFKGVKVMDKIPTIAELKDEFIAGTLKPTKVLRNDKKGTIIDWSLQTLEPYEERIISYKLRSKLSILGLFNLPPALIKFVSGGRERNVLSNKVKAAKVK